jgi:hypothetical protein
MTAKPFRPAVRGIMRAAILTGGTHLRVCRFVKYDTRKGRYAVYRAIGGRLGGGWYLRRGRRRTRCYTAARRAGASICRACGRKGWRSE